jgi:hypothetical protein
MLSIQWKDVAIFSIPFAILLLGAVIWLFIRRTVRTRLKMAQQLKADPQISEWMVIFTWSRKVLYLPTVIAGLVAAALMGIHESGWVTFAPALIKIIGGVWIAIFFVNSLIDEYEMNLKVLLLITLSVAVLVLWLVLMNWLTPFLQFFKHLGVQVNSMGYLLLSAIFLLSVVTSWLKGLFYYIALTPNFLNIQNGPNETSEQISREDFNTRIDTGNFLERMLGFGQIIISFADTRRHPMVFLVGRIGSRAQKLESVRGHLAVEAVRPAEETPEGQAK